MKSYLKFRTVIFLGCLLMGNVIVAQDMAAEVSSPQEQSQEHHHHGASTGAQHTSAEAHGEHEMHMQTESFLESIREHEFAGTDLEPVSTPSSMLMSVRGNWMLMLHGTAFLNQVQQSGPHGDAKLFSTNWIMPMAQRTFHSGTLSLRAMFSLEPATVTQRRYPELFQQGETAFGMPIVDGQHPHDFLMEIAALYDLSLGEKTLLSFYAAPVGAPAMGPPAYPHRTSASENPLAPLGHHLQDSTHVADDVLTLGLTHRSVRLEASAFHGREPDENRWDFDSGNLDSWSTRLTVSPWRNWSGQYSFAHLGSPEALHTEDNIDRMTASIAYNRPLANGNWASLLVWGRNSDSPGHLIWNSYLAESTLRFANTNYLWGRLENVDRTNELLLKNTPEPANFQESIIGRIKALTLGYDREFKFIPHLATAIGGQASFYATPDSLKPIYGSHPVGVLLFVRLRLVP
jgi:hypothetical protein